MVSWEVSQIDARGALQRQCPKDVMCVAGRLGPRRLLLCLRKLTHRRNLADVKSARKSYPIACRENTEGPAVERSLTSVRSVGKPSGCAHSSISTRESTPERSRSSALSVEKPFA